MAYLNRAWLGRARHRLVQALRGGGRLVSASSAEPSEQELGILRFASFEEYQKELPAITAEREAQFREEERLKSREERFFVSGVCYVCDASVEFLVDYMYSAPTESAEKTPNWRERVVCPSCSLNNRMRATIHLFESLLKAREDSKVYIAEQTAPIYQAFLRRYNHVTGSEFLGDAVPFGHKDSRGIRNEDLTNLSFSDASFDFVVSLDVFEHVSDYSKALAECCRVLRDGGKLLVTVPFRIDLEENLVRAAVREDGVIEHYLEPEYHGDPLSTEGCLAFYHFGWSLLRQLREAGFREAHAFLYWSRRFCYLGGSQTFFVATK